MSRRYWKIVLAALLVSLITAGCNMAVVTQSPKIAPTETSITAPMGSSSMDSGTKDVDDASTSTPGISHIRACVYQDYYMSGWELEFDGGVIYADAPSGTGSEMVNAYIRRSDGGEHLVTHHMGAFENAYLSGEWLYFSYADTDECVYNTCRINISSPDEPEVLNVFTIFATDDYFYFRKGNDYTTIDYSNVYRRDANFANERQIFTDVKNRWCLAPAGDKIIAFSDDIDDAQGNVITVHDQDGEALFEIQVDSRMSYDFPFRVYSGALFWCDRADTPDAPIRVHMLKLDTGDVTDIPESFLDIDGRIYGIVDVDDTWVYVVVSLPYPEDYDEETLFPNTHLYRMPRMGGDLEFVRSWFES